MAAILIPLALGLLAALASAVGLWLALSLLLMPWLEVSFALLPALIVIPSLMLGGFVAGRKTRMGNLALKLSMGAIVGILAMVCLALITSASGVLWFFVLLALGAAAIGSFGAFLSTRSQNAL
ncbi:MAG: hypothetical protein R6W80_14965 [Haliea sp.]